jgi:uncharacterized SAM-binding protein YcdF (DUF218 family)
MFYSTLLFYVKKLATPFIVPPGIFILLLSVMGVWLLVKRSRKTGLVLIFIGIFMWISALGPVSGVLFRGLESGFKMTAEIKGDVIILLGGGIDDRAPDLTGIGIPSPVMLERTVAAVRLQKRLHVPVIVTGGGYAHQKISEAEVVQRYLVDLGVPPEKILLETKSRDTIENARNTKKICDRIGFKNPVLVTSSYHLKRALLSFRKVEMPVFPFPVGIGSADPYEFVWTDVLPMDYHGISIALREYVGYAAYRILY